MIAQEFAQLSPRIYIHQVEGKGAEPFQTPYFTAFDVAVEEYIQGGVAMDVLLRVATEVVNAPGKLLIPDWAACPTVSQRLPAASLPGGFDQLRKEVDDKIDQICGGR